MAAGPPHEPSDGADGVHLLASLGGALKAFSDAFLHHCHLTEVAGGAAVKQRLVGCEAQSVHVAARIQVVQRIQDHIELLDVLGAELAAQARSVSQHRACANGVPLTPPVLHVAMVRHDLRTRVETQRRLPGNLHSHTARAKSESPSAGHHGHRCAPLPWTAPRDEGGRETAD